MMDWTTYLTENPMKTYRNKIPNGPINQFFEFPAGDFTPGMKVISDLIISNNKDSTTFCYLLLSIHFAKYFRQITTACMSFETIALGLHLVIMVKSVFTHI